MGKEETPAGGRGGKPAGPSPKEEAFFEALPKASGAAESKSQPSTSATS